jgi:hypothetical protein
MNGAVVWFLVGACVPLVAVALVLFWFSPVERCARDQARQLGVGDRAAHELCAVLKH